MLHNEHLVKADELYEIRHDSNGNAIHVFIKDGEAIVFPTLWDFIKYEILGDANVERFYLGEHELVNLYGIDEYNYHRLLFAWNKSVNTQGFREITFSHAGKLVKLGITITKDDEWFMVQDYQVHYSEHYGDILVMKGREEVHTEKI